MHISAHAEISRVDDFIGTRIYLLLVGAMIFYNDDLTVENCFGMYTSFVSECLESTIGDAFKFGKTVPLTQKPVIGLLKGKLTFKTVRKKLQTAFYSEAAYLHSLRNKLLELFKFM